METNNARIIELLPAFKARFLNEDGSVNWSFVPGPKDGALPNLGKVETAVEVIVDALFLAEDRPASRVVLRDWIHYAVAQSTAYYQGRGPGYWDDYKRQYRISPCCCCDWQEMASSKASTLGYTDLARYAVGIQCPASPVGYRRNVAEGWKLESHFDHHRLPFVERHLADLIEGRVNFLTR